MSYAGTGDFEQTILPSPNVALLAPDHRDTYLYRLGDVAGLAAEHYQVNSRMRPWELADVPPEERAEALREWFLRSARTYNPATLVPGGDPPLRPVAALPEPIASLLGRFGPDGQLANSLFVADLVVVLDDEVWLLPPRGDALVFERRVPDWRARLAAAVPPAHRMPVDRAALVLAVTTVPWRHMVLYGERGYRRALMETGALTANVCGLAAQAGLRPHPIVDFVDTDVDDLLGNDGVERFCAALVPLTMAGPDGGNPRSAR